MIGALQGAASAQIQALLADFAARASRQGFRVVGVVEMTAAELAGGCRRLALRDLSTGTVTSISQNLGPGSTSCNLDAGGLAEACARVERAISFGADLVILSKFGKLETQRSGLSDAFHSATAAGLPVLTAVSPTMTKAWHLFAGPLAEFLPADRDSVEAWWSRTKAADALRAVG
jgi:Protein of unknown function (DUF2478)